MLFFLHIDCNCGRVGRRSLTDSKNLKTYISWFTFKPGKRVHQGCILSPCFFNLHAEYIMWDAGLDEAQAGVKIGGRNINNHRSADATGHKGHFVSLVGHTYVQLSFQAQENSLLLFPLLPMEHRETALPELFSASIRNEWKGYFNKLLEVGTTIGPAGWQDLMVWSSASLGWHADERIRRPHLWHKAERN